MVTHQNHFSLKNLWADVFCITLSDQENYQALEATDVSRNLATLIHEAKASNASKVLVRINHESSQKILIPVLSSHGFKKVAERVEYKTPIAQLPKHDSPKLEWSDAEALECSVEELASTMYKIAIGDPNTDPNEDPTPFIQSVMEETTLTSGKKCFQLGFKDGEIAALAIVQTNPQTGWSRIAYMGTLPQFREEGIGADLHRRCFATMREQGAIDYHGGTHTNNKAMIRLFEKSGCMRIKTMSEWLHNIA